MCKITRKQKTQDKNTPVQFLYISCLELEIFFYQELSALRLVVLYSQAAHFLLDPAPPEEITGPTDQKTKQNKQKNNNSGFCG